MDNDIKEIIEEYLKQNNIFIDNNIMYVKGEFIMDEESKWDLTDDNAIFYMGEYINQFIKKYVLDNNKTFNTNIFKLFNLKQITTDFEINFFIDKYFNITKIFDQTKNNQKSIFIKYNKQNQIINYLETIDYNKYKFQFQYKDNELIKATKLDEDNEIIEILTSIDYSSTDTIKIVEEFIKLNVHLPYELFDIEYLELMGYYNP